MAKRVTYDVGALSWDSDHTRNKEDKYGYSGTPWRDDEHMLHCTGCRSWFAVSETSLSLPSGFLPGFLSYCFHCADCAREASLAAAEAAAGDSADLKPAEGEPAQEQFESVDQGLRGIAVAAMYCLTAEAKADVADSEGLRYFDYKSEIIPFIEKHYAGLVGATDGTRTPESIPKSLKGYMNKHCREAKSAASYGLFSKEVREDDLVRFALVNTDKFAHTPLLHKTDYIRRDKKRKAEGSNVRGRSKRKTSAGENGSERTSDQAYPFNTEGYRYTAAEPDPHTPRDAYGDPSFRPARLERVSMCIMDRAPQLKLDDGRLQVTGEKGYCMARASHGVSRGRWFYEVTIGDAEPMEGFPDAHMRLGWAQRYANLQGPVGLCSVSYSWRDLKGTKFHQARGTPYGEEYASGDVLGFLIDLPEAGRPLALTRPVKSEYLVVYKGREYYEEQGGGKVDMSKIGPLPGSKMVCFKNGKSQGVFFENVNEGKYYPAVSLYMGARVKVNFGPNFKHPPTDFEFSPFSDVVHRELADQTLTDCVAKVANGIENFEKKQQEQK